METRAIERLIQSELPESEVHVTGDGSHFEAVVISEDFAGKSLLEKQRLVMSAVRRQIDSGELHALSIKTYTPQEWAAQGD
jgi:acid stress-induced BolA-like protein IbaG/YrbA